MAECNIIFKNGNRVGVLDNNGEESKLFKSLIENPLLNFNQALEAYKQTRGEDFIQSMDEPTLMYQNIAGENFTSYSEALRNSNGEELNMGVFNAEEFKKLGSVSTNTNTNTLEGSINNLIKMEILSDKSFIDVNGEKFLVPEGSNEAKFQINADLTKQLMQKTLGVKAVSLKKDGTLRVNKNAGKIQVGESFVESKDLDKPFSELKEQFGEDLAVRAFTSRFYKDERSKNRGELKEVEFTPENELQEKLTKLLKDMGIKTLSFDEYVKQYKIKNGIEPTATALADLANKVVAFKDGNISEDDLVEEVSHLIEASIPSDQKVNILRNIHKTQEWSDHSDAYMQIYEGNEELVRKEILGKVIANGIKEQFEARQNSEVEDNILNLVKNLFFDFVDRIRAFFQPSFQTELNELNKNVFNNLMNETIIEEFGEVRGNSTLYSANNASLQAKSLYITTKRILNKLQQQSQVLSKQYQSSSDKRILNKVKEALSVKEEEVQEMEIVNAVADVMRVTSSQTNTLKASLKNEENKSFHFSEQENIVYLNLKNEIRPLLLQLRDQLTNEVKGTKETKLIQEELKRTLENIDDLEASVPNRNSPRLDKLVRRIGDKAGMSDADFEKYKDLIKASLVDNQRDTNVIHAHVGSLLQARNPILNLSGDVIERVNLQHVSTFQKSWKPLVNKLDKLRLTDGSVLKRLFNNGYLLNEKDTQKVKDVDIKEKSDILRRLMPIVKYGEPFENKDVDEVLKKLAKDDSSQARILRTSFNNAWAKNLKSRKEPYFDREFTKRMNNHTVVINGESYSKESLSEVSDESLRVDEEYKAETAQIRRNSGESLTKEEQYRIQEINKRRAKESNPRTGDGALIEGLEEVYDEDLKRYVVVLSPSVDSLPEVQNTRAKTIFGLNVISLINQSFFKEEGKSNPKGIPSKFIEALEALPTEVERREFLNNNAYVGFADSYWEALSENQSVLDKLREIGEDGIISDIRRYQSIISNILKQNKVFNKPSEVNFNEMLKENQLSIKDAQTELESLYQKARLVIGETSDENVVLSETVVNEAYATEIANQKINTLNEQLDFISEHTTLKGKSRVEEARLAVITLKGGQGRISKGMNKFFTEDMTNTELDEALLNYAKSKLLPYFKRSEPIGFSEKQNTTPVLDFINDPSVAITPNFSFYEENSNINKTWLANKEAGKEQDTNEYLSKVKDENYFNYFGIDNSGKPTKNEKDWEAREAILEYIDENIAYNGMTGTQNRYMIPGVRKTKAERAAGLTVEGVKETVKDWTRFREEELELGQTIEGDLAELGGDSLLTIPVQYARELQEPKEQTENILYAYALYGQAAALHKARKENIGDILVLEDTLLGTNFEGKKSDATNAYKLLQSQIQHNFYGVKEVFSYEGKIIGTDINVDYGKLAKVVNSFFKWSNISGVVVPITSLFQSTVQKSVETMVGEVTNRSASKVGNKMFLAHAPEAAKEVMGFTSKAFLNVLGEGLGVYNAIERLENSQFSKGTRTALGLTSKLHELGNFPVITRTFLAVMGDYRYVDGRLITFDNFKKLNSDKQSSDIVREWEQKEVFLDDVIYATKEGVLDFKNEEFLKRVSQKMNLKGEELDLELSLKKEQMSQKALAAIQRVDSQIPEHQKSIASRHAGFNFFLSHMNYLLAQLPLRFKDRHYNISEESWQEGTYRTAYNFLHKMIANPKEYRKVWSETMGDDVARKNLKRTMIEIGVVNTLAIAAVLLSNYVDDDDDPMWAAAFGDYILTRVAAETVGSTVGLPSSITGVIENPLMIYSKLEDFKDTFNTDEVKTGAYAGKTKAEKLFRKQWWVTREYERLRDPKLTQDSYNFNSNVNKNLFSNYAILSNFFDKEKE